ncbi:MAG: hypothetical protein WA431_16715, partial [Candidatus Cybelea sp.]
ITAGAVAAVAITLPSILAGAASSRSYENAIVQPVSSAPDVGSAAAPAATTPRTAIETAGAAAIEAALALGPRAADENIKLFDLKSLEERLSSARPCQARRVRLDLARGPRRRPWRTP